MKIGIIGAGKIALKHIAGYQQLGIKDIALFDTNDALKNEVASAYHITPSENLETLLSQADIVNVCTPLMTHKDIIVNALQSGCHVFCEKPLCQNIEEANEINAAAKNARKLVMTGYLYRFHPRFQQVKQWLQEKVIGNIHFGIFRIGGRGNHRKWKHLIETGGGCINEMLIHKLDLLCYFFNKIDNLALLSQDTLLQDRDIDGEKFKATAEDNVLLKLNADGAKIFCQADFTSPFYMEYLELHGDNGTIFTSILDIFPTILHLKSTAGEYSEGTHSLPPLPQENLFASELGHFIKCINNNTSHTNTVNDSIKLMELTHSIRQQAEVIDD